MPKVATVRGVEVTQLLALEMADEAESRLLEEAAILGQTYEANPMMDAMKDGILAIRCLRFMIEHPSENA